VSPFNFTAQLQATCGDMIARLPELSHIDISRISVSYSRVRNSSQFGIYASLTPLRFAHGSRTTRRRGRLYTMQRVVSPAGIEMLYILSVYLPRFMELPYHEKLVTILHELWHVSPQFDGDLRRHPGRCYAHSSSQKEYDAAMAVLARRWHELNPPAECYEFLTCSWDELCRRHGQVVGSRIRRPRLIPLAAPPRG